MANAKISELVELTTPATGDLLAIVDISDTDPSASGETKKITLSNLQSVFGAPITLLKANSGSSTNQSANNLDTLSISGLTALDSLLVLVTFDQDGGGVGAASGPLILQNSTDTLTITDFGNSNTLAGGNVWTHQATIQNTKLALTDVACFKLGNNGGGATQGGGTGALMDIRGGSVTFTTNWTGSWTLALRTNGQTAAGTLHWSWKVYKLAGQ